ncbi:MAG: hypothetical protein ACOVQ0_06635 [Novosphingobium sp.]|uniref:hypothetical protein n=1 Tax=Novosphingobium sp. TaxID=1874826 RepID=UPI003B992D6D
MKQMKSVKLNEVEKIKATLADLPEKKREDLGLREAIVAMKSEIQSALNKGYSLEEIIHIVGETNQTIGGASISTVRQYMRQDMTTFKSSEKSNKSDKKKTKSEIKNEEIEKTKVTTKNDPSQRTSAAFEAP